MKRKYCAGFATGLFLAGMVGIANADLMNVALDGTASQSSTLTWEGVTGYASNAIDGNTTPNWDFSSDTNNSISHTTNSEDMAWWQVELDQTYAIEELDIWNRAEYGSRLDDFNISIIDSGTSSTVWSSLNNTTFSGTLHVDLGSSVVGDTVRIQLNGTNYLHLAEVEVWGTSIATQNFSSDIVPTTPTPTPEPATMLLFGTGLAGLMASRVRKKKV